MLNNFIFPISWDFFLRFQEYLSFQNLTFHFEVKLNEYLIFYKSIYYLCNLIFQAAVLFFIFILSTFVTPPEVLYQLAMSIMQILIYELVIFYMIFKTKLGTFLGRQPIKTNQNSYGKEQIT